MGAEVGTGLLELPTYQVHDVPLLAPAGTVMFGG